MGIKFDLYSTCITPQYEMAEPVQLPTPPSSSPLKIPDDRPPPEAPPLDDFEYNPNVPLSKRRQFAWLDRTKTWETLQPVSDWRARKVLGKGTSGLCAVIDHLSDPICSVVVKQTLAAEAPSLHNESKLLHLLASTGTEHIVKQLKGYHRGGGTGTSVVDPLPYGDMVDDYDLDYEVARIFLEHLPGGDMYVGIFKEIFQIQGLVDMPEEHLWRILLCLAKAALVLGESHS